MGRYAYYLLAVVLFSNQGCFGCEPGRERLILKCYTHVDDYKAKFVETSVPNFNTDLSAFAKIIFMTEGRVHEICSDTFQLSDLEVLQMNYMGVGSIQEGSFSNLKKLRVINLKANNLTEIGPNIFSDLPIRYLLLTSNKISSIHGEAFDRMPNLEIISLEDNKLSYINPSWFKFTKNIRVLSLENNAITEVPMRAFIHLESKPDAPMKLYLNYNRITTIHKLAFENIQYFEILELSHNRLKNVTRDIFSNAVSIKQFKLDYNDLNIEQEDLRTYEKVQQLSFVGNFNVDCLFIRDFESWSTPTVNRTVYSRAQCTPVGAQNQV